jgi:hypothetical protein
VEVSTEPANRPSRGCPPGEKIRIVQSDRSCSVNRLTVSGVPGEMTIYLNHLSTHGDGFGANETRRCQDWSALSVRESI